MSFEIKQGDALSVLREMPDESVQTCVTSPPYYGLRDYGIDGQIGLESTPQEFIDKLIEIFCEVRRILRPDGTAWVNIGDSYASAWPCNRRSTIGAGSLENGKREARPPRLGWNLKDKDLMMMPARVAIALQDDGWYLRQDIIWHKPNPMPESVTDRCTKSHEYIFLLTKAERYYYDSEAIKEPAAYDPTKTKFPDGWDTGEGGHGSFHRNGREKGKANDATKSWKGSQFHTGKTAIDQLERSSANRDRSLTRNRNGITGSLDAFMSETRNKRSVWTISTMPMPEAHFATFPPKLIEPCILAGSREGDTVLDPFNGAGTTGLVSLKHRRNYIGIELNPEYIKISEKRLREVQVNLF
jgi:DNA modification methylase